MHRKVACTDLGYESKRLYYYSNVVTAKMLAQQAIQYFLGQFILPFNFFYYICHRQKNRVTRQRSN